MKKMLCITMHHLAIAQSGTSLLVATQDDFFCHLAGQSVPTVLAIGHWIGHINAIKKPFKLIFLTVKRNKYLEVTSIWTQASKTGTILKVQKKVAEKHFVKYSKSSHFY